QRIRERDAFMLARAVCPEDCKIKIGLGEVDSSIRRDEREAHIGRLLAVSREPRCQPFGSEVARSSDRQRLGRLSRLHRAHRFLELEEGLAWRLKPRSGLAGQLQPLWRTAE